MGEAVAGTAGGAGVLIIAAAVVVVGIGLWFIFKHYCRLTVIPSSTPIVVKQYATASLTTTLERKSWLGGSWTAVVPASYNATSNGNASATVAGSPTTTTVNSATVTVTGAYTGSDTIKITASGYDCSLAGDLPVSIT